MPSLSVSARSSARVPRLFSARALARARAAAAPCQDPRAVVEGDALHDGARIFARCSPSGTRRALTAALELSVERCVQAYDETGRAESLERWLASELGENLLEDEREHRAGASPRRHGITPAGFLRRVLRDGAGVADPSRRADPERVARTLAAELKRRFESRRATLRERHVCITWRRPFTNLSTMSRAATADLSAALAAPEDEFEALVEAAVAERDGARSGDAEAEEADGGGRPAAGVFFSNAGWSSRGSHLGEG